MHGATGTKSSAPRKGPSQRSRQHGYEGTCSIPAREVPSSVHILGDAGLADIDAELEKLAMDSRCSPQRIDDAHLADQPADLQRHRWSTATASRSPAPIQPKTGAVPADHGIGSDDCKCIIHLG